jgi:hypothetical protein
MSRHGLSLIGRPFSLIKPENFPVKFCRLTHGQRHNPARPILRRQGCAVKPLLGYLDPDSPTVAKNDRTSPTLQIVHANEFMAPTSAKPTYRYFPLRPFGRVPTHALGKVCATRHFEAALV